MDTWHDHGNEVRRTVGNTSLTIPKDARNRDWNLLQEAIARHDAEVIDPPTAQAAVPGVVTRFQARAALLQAGLLDAATAAVEATNDAFTKLAWAEASEWRRDSALVVSMASAIGLTSDQIDDLFRAAAEITA